MKKIVKLLNQLGYPTLANQVEFFEFQKDAKKEFKELLKKALLAQKYSKGLITQIQTLLSELDYPSMSEIGAQPPIIFERGGENRFSAIENFYQYDVAVVTYVNNILVEDFEVDYEDLSEDILTEILTVLKNYKVELEKTMKRCQ